ncbi:MAG: M14 family metallopeptidase [Bacteroidetes bacterium]|nr:M14 family metallopeptidase [Bacteroidota bacterium]
MKLIVSIISVLLCFLHSSGQQTAFEKSGGKKTATYAEVVEWYKQLDKSSPRILVKETGTTDAGYPLQLVLVSNDGKFNPTVWHRQKKVVILINNGIHPGEPDGIDASMMLVRDIKTGKIKLPDNVTLGIIPVYNIGGCLNRNSSTRVNQNGPEEYGFRGNSQNLDLNRDFTKCDSKEAKTFAQIFHYLNPDIFLDTHVSDGADYQHTMTLITTQYDKLGTIAGNWLKKQFEPAVYNEMSAKGWDLIPYVDFSNNEFFTKGMTMFYETPRYSSGYAALFNTFSFISETHMLKTFSQRVKSTYDLELSFINTASKKAGELIATRENARESAMHQTMFPLKWQVDTTYFSEITFKGYEADSSMSEATGLQKMFYNHAKPYTKKIKFYYTYVPSIQVQKPLAYIIPQGWQAVVDLLELNGVAIKRISSDTDITVTTYHIDEYKSYDKPYEKHHKNYAVKISADRQQIHFLKGDCLVEMNQPVNRYIIEMLEPNGDDSFFAWNFFDAILQQKEGYSDYRWEDVATEILSKDLALKQKLDNKKKADPKFAADASAILDFIYKNSSWYEKAHLRYPVFRID